MLTDSYDVAPSVILDALRLMFSILDGVTYGLLQLIYRLFFNVASSDIFANDTIMKFYSRIQLILGVFMMFQLAMIILKGIVNPDSFTDSKTGAGNLIIRVCVALFLLTSLVPISIPSPQNEYEKQINNNGLLFGTLYSLQHRVLENNTLGRLILGTNDTDESNMTSVNSNSDSLKKASRIFAATILKGFYRINLLPEDQRSDKCNEADDPAIYNECRMCQSGIDAYIDEYKKVDASPDVIIALVNDKCDYHANAAYYLPFKYLSGNKRYVLTYSPLISTITGVVFIFIMISFTIDVAVRAIKLAILRLIAPIPIISYMDPKGSKDSAFNAWVKILTSTYIDLFIRLAIVYFILFLIQRIIVDGLVVSGTGIVKIFSYIAIFIGMFIFAKQAPKFMRQALGIKDDNFKLFGGLNEALGVGAMGAGVVSGGLSAGMAAHENGANIGQSILKGLTGAAGGGYNAGKAYYGSKDTNPANIMKGNRAYAEKQYKDAADESTFKGRMQAAAQSTVGLPTEYQQMQTKIDDYKAANKAFDRMNSVLDGDNKKYNTVNGPTYTDNNNHAWDLSQLGFNDSTYTVKDLNDHYNNMKAAGRSTDELKAMDKIIKEAKRQRLQEIAHDGENGGVFEFSDGSSDVKGQQMYQEMEKMKKVGKKYETNKDEVFITMQGVTHIEDMFTDGTAYGNFKGAFSNAGGQASLEENSPDYARAKANAQRAKEKSSGN